MKLKIFALIALLFLFNGCDSTSTTANTDVNNENPSAKTVSSWYMKTVAGMTLADGTIYTYEKGGIFGELEESSDEKDRYDILAFGTSVLKVIFPKTEWVDGGESASDYRATKEGDVSKVWTFQVKNEQDVNLTNAQLTLSLDGPYDVVFTNKNGYISFEEKLSYDTSKKTSITLIDVDNQTEYSYSELQTANLTMDGLSIRTFRWVLGSVDSSAYNEVIAPSTKVANFNVSARSAKVSAISNSNDKFGLPPSF